MAVLPDVYLSYYICSRLELCNTSDELVYFDRFIGYLRELKFGIAPRAITARQYSRQSSYYGVFEERMVFATLKSICYDGAYQLGKVIMDNRNLMPHEEEVVTVKLSVDIEDTLKLLEERLRLACQPVDLMDGFKKVHRHIFENPEQVMFLTREQIKTFVNCGELCCNSVIKTTTKSSGAKKITNEGLMSLFAPAAATAGPTKSLAELLEEKKAAKNKGA